MTEIKCRLLGGVRTPQQLCVSCGMPIGESKASITANAGLGKQTLSLKFPICQECDAARQRVDKVEGKRAGWGCLIGLPIGVAGYFIFHFLTSRVTISWIGILLGWFLAYAAIYLLFGKKFTKETIDLYDQEVSDRVKSAVKLSGFKEAHAWTDGAVTIHFENASYAGAFRSANFANVLQITE